MATDTVDLECPSCAPGSRLARAAGTLGGHVCRSCRGAFVPPERAFTFASRLQSGRPAPGTLQLGCPACGAWMDWRSLAGMQAASCAGCGGAWLTSAALVAETLPAPGQPRAAPAGERTLRVPVWAVAAVGGLALVALLGARLLGRSPPPAAAATPAPEAPESPIPHTVAPRLPPPAEPLHGGRERAWWQERLGALRARPDAEGRQLFEETLRRARANGLVVTGEDGGALRVAEGEPPAPGALP